MTMIIDKFALPEGADRRKKLSDGDREEIIRTFREEGVGICALARQFGVDKRTIGFILFPERLERHKKLSQERQRDGRYKKSRKERTEIMRKYREHKKQSLINAGVIKKTK